MRRELTASSPVAKLEDFDHFAAKIKRVVLEPWNLTACNNTEIRIELRDTDYSIRDFNLKSTCSYHVKNFVNKSRNADNEQSNMVATKRCAWGTCRNDSRYPHLLTKNPKGDEVRFYRFPAPKRWKESAEKRKRWIVACHRGDSFACEKDSYICSLHFAGVNGPTPENPDPISATASR